MSNLANADDPIEGLVFFIRWILPSVFIVLSKATFFYNSFFKQPHSPQKKKKYRSLGFFSFFYRATYIVLNARDVVHSKDSFIVVTLRSCTSFWVFFIKKRQAYEISFYKREVLRFNFLTYYCGIKNVIIVLKSMIFDVTLPSDVFFGLKTVRYADYSI